MSSKLCACFAHSHSQTCLTRNFFSPRVSKYCSNSLRLKCRIFFFSCFTAQRYDYYRDPAGYRGAMRIPDWGRGFRARGGRSGGLQLGGGFRAGAGGPAAVPGFGRGL